MLLSNYKAIQLDGFLCDSCRNQMNIGMILDDPGAFKISWSLIQNPGSIYTGIRCTPTDRFSKGARLSPESNRKQYTKGSVSAGIPPCLAIGDDTLTLIELYIANNLRNYGGGADLEQIPYSAQIDRQYKSIAVYSFLRRFYL